MNKLIIYPADKEEKEWIIAILKRNMIDVVGYLFMMVWLFLIGGTFIVGLMYLFVGNVLKGLGILLISRILFSLFQDW